MATFLAYVDAVPGRLYPLVATLLELSRRGHRVIVRCGVSDVELLRSVGLEAGPLAPPIERFDPDDWRARTRFGALMSGLRQFGERAPAQAEDLANAIGDVHPDVLFIDEGAWGAAAAAERSGLPWAFSLVSAMPLTSRDAPPFGLGLRPRHDAVGRVRDRVIGALTLGSLERIIASHLNPLRAELGVRRSRRSTSSTWLPISCSRSPPSRSSTRAQTGRRRSGLSAQGCGSRMPRHLRG
jgi:hypothetical protein